MTDPTAANESARVCQPLASLAALARRLCAAALAAVGADCLIAWSLALGIEAAGRLIELESDD